jgi:hypothetical protein
MDLTHLLDAQDNVITRRQALELMADSSMQHRLKRYWRILLPGVYLAATGMPTERQRRRAALMYAGPDTQLTDVTALSTYGVRYLPADPTTYVLIPASERRVSRDGVVIKRSTRMPDARRIAGLAYSPPERALADFAARVGDERNALAVIADAIQRKIVSANDVIEELSHVTGRGAGVASRIKTRITSGARSVPEADLIALCGRSAILPEPLINSLLELPNGRRVSPDLLFADAGLVVEVNGRNVHAATDLFDDMQERHDAMTAAGLVVLHCSPYQLRTEPARIVAQIEECYLRRRSLGLPAGVLLLRSTAA